jgi:RimJ/RimL family protein N-acetyltransferase
MMHGWIPLWTADEINAASIAVAQNLGFEKVGEYPDFYFMFG